ncbi:class I SAM-dependent methyltransferase [bacterium]|nr:class I SAM-dependent methyltransferase [bacterium]
MTREPKEGRLPVADGETANVKQMASIGEMLGEHLSFAGKVVVDVGCGTGELVRWLVRQGSTVTGVDTPAMLARAEAAPPAGGERYLPGGGESLPLPAQHADLVIWAASLHHVPADRLRDAIAECARILRPGGEAAFVEPVGEPGSYYEITRLTGDEREIQALAYAAILDAPSAGLEATFEGFGYLSRSFADYEHLVEAFVDSAELRAECLSRARPITEGLAAAAGVSFEDFRYRSICRLNILRRAGRDGSRPQGHPDRDPGDDGRPLGIR